MRYMGICQGDFSYMMTEKRRKEKVSLSLSSNSHQEIIAKE